MIRFIVSIILCVGGFFLYAQDDFYFEDYVYVEQIKSVKFHPVNDPPRYPVYKMGDNTPLHFSFDDLDAVDKRYTYSIYHCDMNWELSDLVESDYLQGFNGEELTGSGYSVQTRISYVHYDLFLPNEYISWKISGNYLLVIRDEDKNPVITKRFLVVDPKVSVNAVFERPKDVSTLYTHQSLVVSIETNDLYIRDPLNEVKVSVLQNFRWLDGIFNVSPKFIAGSRLNFDVFTPFSFKGYKDFRSFDIRSLQYTNRNVYSINIKPRRIDVLLEKTRNRNGANYLTELDANGNFIIGTNGSMYGDRGAEYANVGFTLEASQPFEKHDVYIIGGFSDWQLYESNKMRYDPANAFYVADVLFKQGFYDYYYALVDQNGQYNLDALEGSWHETENDYYVLVYIREFGAYYDKLIGYFVIKS